MYTPPTLTTLLAELRAGPLPAELDEDEARGLLRLGRPHRGGLPDWTAATAAWAAAVEAWGPELAAVVGPDIAAGLPDLLLFLRGQVEGRWEPERPADPAPGAPVSDDELLLAWVERLTGWLVRDLPEAHPAREAAVGFAEMLARLHEARERARPHFALLIRHHPDLLVAALPELRPAATLHLALLHELPRLRGEPAAFAVLDALEVWWRTRREGLAPGPTRERAHVVLRRIDVVSELVGRPEPVHPPAVRAELAAAAVGADPGDLRSRRRLAAALGEAGRPAEALDAWLALLEHMDNEHGEAGVLLAAAAEAERAGRAAEAEELRDWTRRSSPPASPEAVAEALGAPAPYLRLRAFNVAQQHPSPAVAEALVGLLARPVYGPPWARLATMLAWPLLRMDEEGVASAALATVEIASGNEAAWVAAAATVGGPALRTRGDALLAAHPELDPGLRARWADRCAGWEEESEGG